MTPQLSKSRFQYGLQCLKRLYLESYHPELADPVDPGLQARFDTGTTVGEVARQRFPNGRLIEETHLEHDQAVETTQALLSDASVSALYEPAFTFQGIRTRVDVLNRNASSEFDLVEVKSSTKLKPEHITDVAIQVYAVEGSGIPIKGAYLMHLNNTYVYPGGEHDLEQLFTLQDVTVPARSFIERRVPDDLSHMWSTLELDSPPNIPTGRHCTRPYCCSFYGHCHQDEPKTNGRPFISTSLASRLEEITFPAGFLDFETVSPAIPLYLGTRPYQPIPFQWSLHILDSSGRLTHDSFLSDDAEDPRERFIITLLEAIPRQGAIVTYSSYEKSILSGLARAFPLYRNRLLSLCDRMVDLLKLVRENYYHPGFNGSYSLKSVAPTLVPDLDYTDIEIQDGTAASTAYTKLIIDGTSDSEKAGLRNALLSYCARDTEAMVRIYEALRAESENSELR